MTWTPADLTTLTAWYDASDPATVNETAGSVISLADKSGGGHDATSDAGAEEPTLGSIGGLTALSFDGVDDNLQTALFHNRAADVSIFFIAAPNGTDTETGAPVTGGGAKNLNIEVDSTGLVRVQNRNQYTNNSQRVGSTLGAYVVGVTVEAAGPTISLGVDGTYVSQAMDASANTKAFELGSRFEGTQLNYRGLLGEVVIVQALLSTADIQKVEGYLAHKWGTEGALPAGHPYKATAPGGAVAASPFSGTAVQGALAVSGAQPALTVGVAIDLTPAAPSVVITGHQPGVDVGQGVSLAPSGAAITITGGQPGLSVGRGVSLEPAGTTIAVTGGQPGLAIGGGFGGTAGQGSIAFTGRQPGLDAGRAFLGQALQGAVIIAGHQPGLSVGSGVNVRPDRGAVAITGNQPALSVGQSLAPSGNVVAFTGGQPEFVSLKPITLSSARTIRAANQGRTLQPAGHRTIIAA